MAVCCLGRVTWLSRMFVVAVNLVSGMRFSSQIIMIKSEPRFEFCGRFRSVGFMLSSLD